MAVLRREVRFIRADEDVVAARRIVRELAVLVGFSLVDQTKVVTAASELARNALQHGGGGTLTASALNDDTRRGLRLIFEDQGPGIADVQLAMKDGYTSGGGAGHGRSRGHRRTKTKQKGKICRLKPTVKRDSH